jgi:ketosteroid isomerase-like protein
LGVARATPSLRAMITNPADIHHEFAAAASSGDLDRLIQLYERGATVISPPGEQGPGERREGIEAIRAHLNGLLAMQPKMRILASKAHEKGDLALLSSHWQAQVRLPDGREHELEGHGSELARRQPDGSWLLVIDNPGGAGS